MMKTIMDWRIRALVIAIIVMVLYTLAAYSVIDYHAALIITLGAVTYNATIAWFQKEPKGGKT